MLVLKPLGGGSVRIGQTDYGYWKSWDGSGRFQDSGMIEGEYAVGVTPRGEETEIWASVWVRPGATCKYRLDLSGARVWQLRECE